jgi:serine protease Do
MRGFALPGVALLVLVALASPLRAEEDILAATERRQEELFTRAGPAVVFLSAGSGFGSGFFVAPGLILTAGHVPGDEREVEVVTSTGQRLRGRVVEKLKDIDLALVRVSLTKHATLAIEPRPELRVGSWVASIGHGRGGLWSFNTGMVSNIYPDGDDRPIFQTQIPLNPGNSGGPVLDRHGRVVGIVTSGIEGSNSINFAIRGEVALRQLSLLSTDCACFVVSAPAGVTVFVDGKLAGVGPRVTVQAEPREYEVMGAVGGVLKKVRLRFPEEHAVTLK